MTRRKPMTWLDGLAAALRRPMFLICAAVVAIPAFGFHGVIQALGLHLVKEAVPLRKPLSQLDRDALAPYRFVASKVLSPEMVESLGTEQYIQWQLEDPRVEGPQDPRRHLSLFVTYYTGNPSQVPHVPEVCYLGSGYRLAEGGVQTMAVPELGAARQTVRIKTLTFATSKLRGDRPTVVYLFDANNQFCTERSEVRTILGNPFARYAYFSKVEVSVGYPGASPGRTQAVEASQELLKRVLPVLVRDHWPDLEQRPGDPTD